MFVGVIHHVHDPEGFQASEAEARAAGLAEGVAWAVKAASRDDRVWICVWEGESVTAVRDVVERAFGPFADNGYEMDVDGLAPQPP